MQQALHRSTLVKGSLVPGRTFKSQCRGHCVVVRAKELREFREDSGEVIVPGEEKKGASDNALYADQVPPAMRKKDNLSKEMKQRLRQEYYGLGGAENKAMDSNYFLWIIAIVAVLAVLSKLTGAI